MSTVRTQVRQRAWATALTLVAVASTTACSLATDVIRDGCSDEDYEVAHQVQSLVEDVTGSLPEVIGDCEGAGGGIRVQVVSPSARDVDAITHALQCEPRGNKDEPACVMHGRRILITSDRDDLTLSVS